MGLRRLCAERTMQSSTATQHGGDEQHGVAETLSRAEFRWWFRNHALNPATDPDSRKPSGRQA
jgi:hypothetical protein